MDVTVRSSRDGLDPDEVGGACNQAIGGWLGSPHGRRSSHIASVSPLSHQCSGWTTPRTGQPRVLASREIPLHGWRTDHIVPTPRVSSPLSAPSPDGGGRGTLRRLLGRHRGQTRRRSSPRLDRTVTGGQVSRGSTLNPRLLSGVPRCPCCRSEISGCVREAFENRIAKGLVSAAFFDRVKKHTAVGLR